MSGHSRRSRWLALAVLVPAVALAVDVPSAAPTDERPASAAPPPKKGSPSKAPVERPVDISDPVLRKAIADSKDPLDDILPVGRAAFGTGGATAQQRIDRRFKEAEIPTCLTADAFEFDPPSIGPIGFAGFLALPFWVHAITSGRCRH